MCNHESTQETSFGAICTDCWSHYPFPMNAVNTKSEKPIITLYSQLLSAVRLMNTTVNRQCVLYRSAKYPNGVSMTWVKEVMTTGRSLDPEIYDHFYKLIVSSGFKPMKITKAA